MEDNNAESYDLAEQLDKSLKEELGYIEEQRIKSYQLANSPRYQARKEYVNDPYIKNTKG